MAFSKIASTAALCRALVRCSENGPVLRTCVTRVAFRQPDYATRFSRVQTISTSCCNYERQFVRRSSAYLPKFSGRVCKSTDKGSSSKTITKASETTVPENKTASTDTQGQTQNEEKLGVIQRFKNAYKQHGKVLIGVHVATSVVWYGTFWYTVHVGVDVVSFFEWLGISERILQPMRNSGAGDFAVAYLMYKVATPARYTVTLAGTNYMIKYLRKVGKMDPQQEKMRDLMKASKKELKPKFSKPHIEKLKHRLKTVQIKSKSRVQNLRSRSQRRLVQLRKFIRSSRKKKS